MAGLARPAQGLEPGRAGAWPRPAGAKARSHISVRAFMWRGFAALRRSWTSRHRESGLRRIRCPRSFTRRGVLLRESTIRS